MRNVTLAIEDEVLRRARLRAVQEGTTVNAIIRKYLAEYGSSEERLREAMDRILESSEKYGGRMKGGKWRREDAYRGRVPRGR